MIKRSAVALLALSLSVMVAPPALAMTGMAMPTAPSHSAPAPAAPGAAAKLDPAAARTLAETALAGLNLTEDQLMKVHDFLVDYIRPMDELMAAIEKSTGTERGLKEQEMMLLMETAQVQVDSVLDDPQAQLFDALIFGVFPDAKAYPAEKASVARLKAAADLRAAIDDHEVTRVVIARLAGLMPAMPGMTMSQ